MKKLFKYLDEKRAEFGQNVALMLPVEEPHCLEDFASSFYFWVLTFQDVMRRTRSGIVDRQMQKTASLIVVEDIDHDLWYLEDMVKLNAEKTPRWLWSNEHRITRSVSYDILGLADKVEHDSSRIALLYALELAGKEFFPIASLIFREQEGLKWFSQNHVEAEMGHTIYKDRGLGSPEASLADNSSASPEPQLESIELSEKALSEAYSTVDMVFDRMSCLVEHAIGRL